MGKKCNRSNLFRSVSHELIKFRKNFSLKLKSFSRSKINFAFLVSPKNVLPIFHICISQSQTKILVSSFKYHYKC